MPNTHSPRRLGLIACLAIAACMEPTAPPHDDLARAREEWLAADISTYSFAIEGESSWAPNSGVYTVHVRNDAVILAVAPNGDAYPGFNFTIDSLWNRIMFARNTGNLNSASFFETGVPAEADMGYWPAQDGQRFRIHWFDPAR